MLDIEKLMKKVSAFKYFKFSFPSHRFENPAKSIILIAIINKSTQKTIRAMTK